MEISGTRSFTLSLAFLLLCFCSETCNADNSSAKSCTSSCGHIHNIRHPFRLNDDPKYCGDVRYTLYCESNITVLDLPSSGKYYVQAINYNNKTIRLLDPGLDNNNCSSMSQNIPPIYDIDFPYWPTYYSSTFDIDSPSIYYLKCSNPSNSSLYVDTAPCLNNTSSSSSSSSHPKTYSYVMVGGELGFRKVWELDEGCSVEWMSLAAGHVEDYSNFSYKDIHNALMYGFELSFEYPYTQCSGWTVFNMSTCYPHTISGFFRYLWQQIGHEYSHLPGKLRPWLHTFNNEAVRGWFILICIGKVKDTIKRLPLFQASITFINILF